MVEEVGGIHYHHFHRNHTWVGKYPVGSGRLYMGTKAAKRAVSHGKKTAFADVSRYHLLVPGVRYVTKYHSDAAVTGVLLI